MDLHASLAELDAVIRVEGHDGLRPWSSIMLSQVFEIPLVGPTALDLPPELHALRALTISGEEWANRLDVLHELAELPVRKRIASGPVPDPVLRSALIACRRYWLQLGRDWKRKDLAEGHFRETVGGRTGQLTGPAESFVVDVLAASKIDFDLTRLNSAWVGLDSDLRRTRTAS